MNTSAYDEAAERLPGSGAEWSRLNSEQKDQVVELAEEIVHERELARDEGADVGE